MLYILFLWISTSIVLFFINRYKYKKWLYGKQNSYNKPKQIPYIFIGFIAAVLTILTFVIYKYNNEKFNIEYKEINTTIYSLNNEIGVTFVLGTGSLTNDYTTYISENGGYRKHSINSDALIKEDLNDSKTGILTYKVCKSEEIIDLISLKKVKNDCFFKDNYKKDIIIHVPKGTIIKDFKI